MSNFLHYLSYPFVQNALVVGILIALCSALLGVILVLKRFSFIGDGLSHVAFGALSVAMVLKLTNEMMLVLPITVVAAVLLLRAGQNAKIKGDASLAMLSVGALAVGYLLVNLFGESVNLSGDVCSTLFGSTSILTLDRADVWICGIMSVAVILLFLLFYRRIFAVTFDEAFAAATGTNTGLYNLMIAIVTAVVIVVAMELVGSLLISALVIFPALSAMRIFKDFKGVILFAAVIAVLGAAVGIMLSILGPPVGATIVAVHIAIFILCSILGFFKNGG